MTISPNSYVGRFEEMRRLSSDTFSFFLKKPPGFNFFPGQYNRWMLDIKDADDRGTRRSFTIANSPLKDYLAITTKRGESSFKKKLFELEKGENISFFGPLGNFVLEEEDIRPKVFLAGGIGITPYYSMLTYAFEKKLANDITLIASFSTKDEIIYFEELSRITKYFANVKIVYTLTRDEAEGFEKGRINEEMIAKYADPKESVFFIVGPPAMVSATGETVFNMGISEDRIKTENFSGY